MRCSKCKCNCNRADCGMNLMASSAQDVTEFAAKPGPCSCEERTICSSLCRECNEPLCADCVAAHRRVNLTKSHKIISLDALEERDSGVGIYRSHSCRKHAQEKLDRFCERCMKVTCRLCHDTGGDHCAHPYMDVGLGAKLFKENLHTQLKSLEEKVIPAQRLE